VLTDGSIRPAHEPRQLAAGVDAQLGERIADVGFHRMKGKMQLRGDIAVGHALRNQADDPELGVGETVPARFRPRLADDAPFHMTVGLNLYIGLMPWMALRRSRVRSWPRPVR
jgi:hypothetical protein